MQNKNESTSTNVFFNKKSNNSVASRATEFVIRVTRNNLFLLVRSQEGELLA